MTEEIEDIEIMDNGTTNGGHIYIANVVLAYVVYGVDSATINNLNVVLGNNFSETEIIEAKDLLWDTTCLEDKPRRHKSVARPVKEMHIHDIVEGILKLRQLKKMPCFVVKPEDIPRLPLFNAESVNVATMDSRMRNMETKLKEMDTLLKINTNDIVDHGQKLDIIDKVMIENGPQAKPKPTLPSAPSLHLMEVSGDTPVRPSAPPLDVHLAVLNGNGNGAEDGCGDSSTQQKGGVMTTGSDTNLSLDVAKELKGGVMTTSSDINHSPDFATVLIRGPNRSPDDGNGTSDLGFQKPREHQRKEEHRNRRRVIVGTASNCMIKGGTRRYSGPISSLFIYNVDRSVTDDLFIKHMEEKGVKYLHCKRVSHIESRTASYKVLIPRDKFNECMDGDKWPENSKIREYNNVRSSVFYT